MVSAPIASITQSDLSWHQHCFYDSIDFQYSKEHREYRASVWDQVDEAEYQRSCQYRIFEGMGYGRLLEIAEVGTPAHPLALILTNWF
jgi:hypothetical protein